MYHPGREDDKLFLGRICMSPLSLSGCSTVGAERQLDLLNCASQGWGGSHASRTYLQMFPRSHRGLRSPFSELVEKLTADEALRKDRFVYGKQPLWVFPLAFEAHTNLFTDAKAPAHIHGPGQALCRVLTTLDLSSLS